MKAIILSAGQGKRLFPLTEAKPKCLLPLSGRSLLEWQLRGLGAGGVTEAVVVTGFGAPQVDDILRTIAAPGIAVRTLFNPFYGVADNLASCWIARSEMNDEFLILNGDTLFEPSVAERLVSTPPKSAITLTVNRKSRYDSDDMKVTTDGERLVAVGKTLDPSRVDAESIGFLRFTPEGGALFRATMDQMMLDGEGLKNWYLSAIHRIAEKTGKVGVLSIEGLDWGEVDFPADLKANRRMTENWIKRGLFAGLDFSDSDFDSAQEA